MAAISTSLPAPLGGWNARDAWGEMNPLDAVSMTNWWPGTSDLIVRKGYTQFATGLTNQVESLLPYAGGNSNKLFAAAGTKIFNVSAGGAVGAAVVTGLGNARFESVNIATSGGNFMLNINGNDKLQGYDGTNWWKDGDGAHDISVLDTSNVSDISVFKYRVWMIEKNTLNAWYLPTSAIAGAAVQFPLQSVARNGGYLVAMGAWTIDAGYGVDDMLVFITNKGDVIVYRGTDPASATTWFLAGIWSLGSPVGKRCLMKYGGDLLIISQDGLLPLAAALQSSRLDPRVSLTDKIQYAISNAVTLYSATFGWETQYFAKANMLVLNVPVAVGSQEQYVMNTITKAWARFTGWNANCWVVWNDNLYFGSNGYVGQAWNTLGDNATNIQADAAQAFNYFSKPGKQKRFTMVRPTLITNGTPAIFAKMNTDFTTNSNYQPLSVVATTYGTWDTGLEDMAVWADNLGLSRLWQGVTGIGMAGGIELQVVANGIETHWVATDVVFELGSVL
jgi:hypothetical protein